MKPRTRVSAVIALLATSHGLLAQRDRLAADKPLPVRETIADAEAEGAAFPRGAVREHVGSAFAGQWPGSTERKCVSGPLTDLAFSPLQVRSGDFVIGGQVGGSMPPSAGHQSKIWWIPYHDPFDYSTTLLVRGARLGAPGDTIRYTQPDHAWPVGKPKSESFFPSGITLPRAGTWLLTATAGDDWGCFVLST